MEPVSEERLGILGLRNCRSRQRRVQLTSRNPQSRRLRASTLPGGARRRVVGLRQVNQLRQGIGLGLIYSEFRVSNISCICLHVALSRAMPWVLGRSRRSLGSSAAGKQQVGQQNRHSNKTQHLRPVRTFAIEPTWQHDTRVTRWKLYLHTGCHLAYCCLESQL